MQKGISNATDFPPGAADAGAERTFLYGRRAGGMLPRQLHRALPAVVNINSLAFQPEGTIIASGSNAFTETMVTVPGLTLPPAQKFKSATRM